MRDSPKLIYNLATGKWLIQIDESFWTFRSTSDALTIAGYLQINVIDKTNSDYLVIPRGHAKIIEDLDFECHVSLTPTDLSEKPFSVMVYPQTINFGILDCYRGFHTDLWVETDAAIVVENVQSLGLKFYLPSSKDHEGKTLECFIGDKKVTSIELQRGDPTEVWLDVPDPESGPKEIRLKCGYQEPNASDERNLGMIFVDYNINLTEWMPSGGLL